MKTFKPGDEVELVTDWRTIADKEYASDAHERCGDAEDLACCLNSYAPMLVASIATDGDVKLTSDVFVYTSCLQLVNALGDNSEEHY